MKPETQDRITGLIAVVWLLAVAAFWVAVFYAGAHFVRKYW